MSATKTTGYDNSKAIEQHQAAFDTAKATIAELEAKLPQLADAGMRVDLERAKAKLNDARSAAAVAENRLRTAQGLDQQVRADERQRADALAAAAKAGMRADRPRRQLAF